MGDNTCRWAYDGECDDVNFGGTGACDIGTDAMDCLAETDVSANLDGGANSCEYANDNECDEARYDGTGACSDGTDTADCRLLAAGINDDSCEYANDGECDEPGTGTDNCTTGTDVTDCREVAYLRNRTDTCNTAFDGVCNEPMNGNGTCEALTDTADCLGRNRPAGLENHFFGRDDRFLVDTTQLPWRAIGSLELQEGTYFMAVTSPSYRYAGLDDNPLLRRELDKAAKKAKK